METTPTRLMFGLVLVAGGMAASMAFRPDWLTANAGRSASRTHATVVSRPDRSTECLARRIFTRTEIVRRLLAGEVGLAEAASLFRELNAAPPRLSQEVWAALPGRGEGEKLCRQVLRWVEVELASSAEAGEYEARLGRFERELAALLARDGEIILPEM